MSNDLGLGVEEWVALGMITGGRRAWVSGIKESVIRKLIEVGLVERWSSDIWGHELEGGPYATLTPWGAERLGVEIRERHWVKWVRFGSYHERVLVEEPYWARVGSRGSGSFILPSQARQCGLEYPELVPDPVLGPEYLTDGDGEPVTFFGGYRARIDRRLSR